MPGPNGVPSGMSAGALRRHPRPAARAGGAEQLDARRDRPDRRNVDMIVLFGEVLSGCVEHRHRICSARRRSDASHRASRRAGVPRRGGPCAAAWSPAARRSPSARATAAARSCRRLGRLAELGFELGDARKEGFVLRQQIVDPHQQLLHQRLQTVSIQRIKLPGRHPASISPQPFVQSATPE